MDDCKQHIRELFKALKFAAEKHKNQRRKDREASPYINHPIDICNTLCGCGCDLDPKVLVAAVLHDTIEDTNTTPEEIGGLFGEDVLGLVLEVTDDKNLPKAARKDLQVKTARHKSTGAKHIRIADKISNVTDIIKSPPAGWNAERKLEYLRWTEKVIDELVGTNECLERLYRERLAEAIRNVAASG
jgi:GTP diphosphokinase / guanosine-3',5'-bis(diphosphate) 3'-diphosphatase